MPVNMKALRKHARSKKAVAVPTPVAPEPAAAPAPEPAPAPAPEPVVEEDPAPAPEPVVEEDPAPEAEWSLMNTKAELIAAAEAAGVEFKSTWKKAEILAALSE